MATHHEDRGAVNETQFVFFLGTGRCGSSLVHEIVARHPDVGFISNIDDRLATRSGTGRWNNAIYRHIPAYLTQKGRARYAPSEGYNLLDKQVAPLLSRPFRDLVATDATPWLNQRVRTVFDSRALDQSKPVFSHKFTGWPRAGFLSAIFPNARFVHIVRDGRAVANSWLQMPWWDGYKGPFQWQWGPLPEAYEDEWVGSDRSHVVLAGIAWKILIDAFESAQARISPSNWLNIRYEELVSAPKPAMEQLLEFLDLQWTPEFARGFAHYKFDAKRTEAFRDDLAPWDIDQLDMSLKDHLEAWGYS